MGTHTSSPETVTGDDPLIRFAASLVCGMGPAQLNAAEAHRIVTAAGIDPASVAAGGHQHMATASGPDPASLASLLPSLPMLLGHLLAAVATGWLLRRGEIALFRLARLSAHGAQQIAAGARLRALRAALALVDALRAGLPGGRRPGRVSPVPQSTHRHPPPGTRCSTW